jgi:hypothetical protein
MILYNDASWQRREKRKASPKQRSNLSSGRPSSRMKKRSVVHDDKSTSKPFEGLNGRDKNSRTSPRFKPMNKGDDLRPFDAAVAQDQERNRDRKLPPSSPRQSADSPQNSRYSSIPRSNAIATAVLREVVNTTVNGRKSWFKRHLDALGISFFRIQEITSSGEN